MDQVEYIDCPFCKSTLQPLNKKQTIIGCRKEYCKYRFIFIKNNQTFLFYVDVINPRLNQFIEYDVHMSLCKNKTTIKRKSELDPFIISSSIDLDKVFDIYQHFNFEKLKNIILKIEDNIGLM